MEWQFRRFNYILPGKVKGNSRNKTGSISGFICAQIFCPARKNSAALAFVAEALKGEKIYPVAV